MGPPSGIGPASKKKPPSCPPVLVPPVPVLPPVPAVLPPLDEDDVAVKVAPPLPAEQPASRGKARRAKVARMVPMFGRRRREVQRSARTFAEEGADPIPEV